MSLRALVEGDGALAAGTALDLGCGTGDNSIYLAKHGWQVTGVDFVPRALRKAQAKAHADNVGVRFLAADVTRLSRAQLGGDFGLIVDTGCLHGMDAEHRDAYVREISAISRAGTKLLVIAFVPGGAFGVSGIDPAEMERRFTSGWTMLSAGHEPGLDNDSEKGLARFYLFERHT